MFAFKELNPNISYVKVPLRIKFVFVFKELKPSITSFVKVPLKIKFGNFLEARLFRTFINFY